MSYPPKKIQDYFAKVAAPAGPDCVRISDGVNLGPCTVWLGRKDKDGYGHLRFGSRQKWGAARLRWVLAKGEDGRPLHMLHHCDNPSCVNIDHLWLGTNADNIRDRVAKGRGPVGERNSSAKLNADDVREIRILLKTGKSQQKVADVFGVSRSCVKDIVNGLTWSHM